MCECLWDRTETEQTQALVEELGMCFLRQLQLLRQILISVELILTETH